MARANLFIYFFKYFIYLFLEKEKEEERERNINVWLPVERPLLGTLPATQACTLSGIWASDPLAQRPALSPLSHTSQGKNFFLKKTLWGQLAKYESELCISW